MKQRAQGEEHHLLGSDWLRRMQLRDKLSLLVGDALEGAVIGHLKMFEIENDLRRRSLAETMKDPGGRHPQYGVQPLLIDDGKAEAVVCAEPALVGVFGHQLSLMHLALLPHRQAVAADG